MVVTAYGQDPVKTSPQFYKVLLENEQVRVLEYRLKPGEKEPMHSHPAGVVYVLSGTKLKFSYPDGRTEERAAATGETIWRDPVTHAVENVGNTEAMPLLWTSNFYPALNGEFAFIEVVCVVARLRRG